MMDWYERHSCRHGHCPNGCEKPQPTEGSDGNLYCGRCLHERGEVVAMYPCTPDVCD